MSTCQNLATPQSTGLRRSFVALCCAGLAATAQAQMLDTRLVAGGLSQPLLATAPLNDGRVFVAQQGGAVLVVQGGVASTFLSLTVAIESEQGLLGLTFDPNYANASAAGYRRFFVNYIDAANGDTVVASYRTSAANPSLADTTSRVEVIRFDQPDGRTNHKAGWLGFKPGDASNLYIATGDGGGSNDPDNNAQNRGNLLGKMLRIDINNDAFADPNVNYAIPGDNPFAATAGARGEIFAYGLRNPFRNSFDRTTGDLWIADVGQDAQEEIDFISAASGGGHNFGWRLREGTIATPEPGVGGEPPADNVEPMMTYGRSIGRSITGGYVVREAGSPLFGKYVFGDFVTGRIFAIDAADPTPSFAEAIDLTALLDAGSAGPLGMISSFGEGANGELFIVDFTGKVVTVVPEPSSALLLLLGGGALTSAVRCRRARRSTA